MHIQNQNLLDLFEPEITTMGFELLGIELIKNGHISLLRVYIDKFKGVNIDDCVLVSQQLIGLLDVKDPIKGQYNLEVSSPGIERPLFVIAHYQRFLGHDVRLRTYRPIEGKRNFTGSIGSVGETNNTIELVTELGPVTVDIGLIEKSNLIAHF